MATLEDKVDDLAKEQKGTSTALGILVKEVTEMRQDIKTMSGNSGKLDRLCTEHDQRALAVHAIKTELAATQSDVAALRQNVGMRDDGTSKMDDRIDTLTKQCEKYALYFKLMAFAVAALVVFASGIGQRIVLGLLGM